MYTENKKERELAVEIRPRRALHPIFLRADPKFIYRGRDDRDNRGKEESCSGLTHVVKSFDIRHAETSPASVRSTEQRVT